jgi:hypothetical protein
LHSRAPKAGRVSAYFPPKRFPGRPDVVLRGVVVCMADDARMTSPEALDRYRCPDRGGPGGQRCQLLIQHATPPVHIASVGGAFGGWIDGAETALPPSPYPWFVSFPRDES